jgi:hypothetical protein
MRQLLLHVIGDEVGHDDARLVQHDVSERNAFAQCRALQMNRAPGGRFGARQRQR